MGTLLNSFNYHSHDWIEWMTSDAPELDDLPDGFQNKLTVFQRLLLIRYLAPQGTVIALSHFAKETMGFTAPAIGIQGDMLMQKLSSNSL